MGFNSDWNAAKKSAFKNLIKDETGAGAIEYGLIVALVSVAAVATLSSMGTSLSFMFDAVGSELNNASREQLPKAKHMAAPTSSAASFKKPCQQGAVHTWHEAEVNSPIFFVLFPHESELYYPE